MDLSNAAAIFAPKYNDLPNVGQARRIVRSQATTKRKHAAAHQDQPCGIPRKKDRSRPLSELCNGDIWNGSRPNGQKADEHMLGVATCSSSSSGTSTLDTPLDTNSCHRSAASTDQAKGTEISCMTRLLSDDSRHGSDFVGTPPAAQNILEPDHLHRYQPCGLTNNPTWKAEKHACKSIKMRTIRSVGQEGKDRTRDSNDHGCHKTKTGKHEATRDDEAVLLENRLEKRSLNKNKPAEHDTKMHIAIVPSGMDCAGTVQQQHCKSKCGPEQSLETLSSHSNCESGSVSSVVFEKPLHLNPRLYDVELSVLGSSNTGRRVPLVSLMSRLNCKPVVGYPVSVEVSDDLFGCPSSRRDVQLPATSRGNAEEADRLWQPHAKRAGAVTSSSRKTRGDGKSASGATIACIPLRVVFSRINEALRMP